MAGMYEPPSITQLEITILDIEPPIWRRLLVPRKTTLAKLHHIIQAAVGCLDYHLPQFEIGGLRFGDPDMLNADAFDDDSLAWPEEDFRLCDFLPNVPPFLYLYDFGDDWHHRVEVEALLLPEANHKYPACIDGGRSRPPEDVGGVHGYADFLDVFHDPSHTEHADMKRWAGYAFHPEKPDLIKTDRAVRSAERRAALFRYD